MFHLKHIDLVLLLTVLLPQNQTLSKMSTSTNNVVSYNEVLAATNNDDVYIIDVRKPEELQETGKIPNSINIPLTNLESVLSNYTNDEFKEIYGRPKPTFGTDIIFSCQSGKRAQIANVTAVKLGFEKSKIYTGSWLDWISHARK